MALFDGDAVKLTKGVTIFVKDFPVVVDVVLLID